METTGRRFTVKCFSSFWPAPNAATGKKRTPAPSIGSRVRFNLGEQIMAGNMLVNAPSAIEHRGQQFCFLLISNREIFASQLIVGVFLQPALALIDELVQRLEVLTQGNVYAILTAKARLLDYSYLIALHLSEFFAGLTERFVDCRRRKS